MREDMAAALVVPVLSSDDEVFEIVAQVANEENAWRAREIVLDGQAIGGFEREYEDSWIAYCVTPTRVFYVRAPTAMRLDVVELREISPDEAPDRRECLE